MLNKLWGCICRKRRAREWSEYTDRQAFTPSAKIVNFSCDRKGRIPQNKHDGVLIHRDRLMDLKKRFQKKRKPSYIFETSPIFSYDERIIDIHNIKACCVPVDQDTLALVNKYFNNRQWVSKKDLEERIKELEQQYLVKKERIEILKNQIDSFEEQHYNCNSENEEVSSDLQKPKSLFSYTTYGGH